jgi:hypothetical protein
VKYTVEVKATSGKTMETLEKSFAVKSVENLRTMDDLQIRP